MPFVHATRRGFTIVELLVVIGIIGLLIAFLLPSLCRSREGGNRVKCASNLRQIGLALQMYANENKGNFPRATFDDAADQPTPTSFTNPNAASPFASGGPAPNDVTAAFFLLLRTQDLTSEVFICPSSSDERFVADATTLSNFPDPSSLSFSYNNPYLSKVAAEASGNRLTSQMPTDFAIAADINPGTRALLTTAADAPRVKLFNVNSPNHGGDGQNILYTDGHVEFETTPFAGMRRSSTGHRDNIYTAGGAGTSEAESIKGCMADPNDSILTRCAKHASRRSRPSAAGRRSRDGRSRHRLDHGRRRRGDRPRLVLRRTRLPPEALEIGDNLN